MPLQAIRCGVAILSDRLYPRLRPGVCHRVPDRVGRDAGRAARGAPAGRAGPAGRAALASRCRAPHGRHSDVPRLHRCGACHAAPAPSPLSAPPRSGGAAPTNRPADRRDGRLPVRPARRPARADEQAAVRGPGRVRPDRHRIHHLHPAGEQPLHERADHLPLAGGRPVHDLLVHRDDQHGQLAGWAGWAGRGGVGDRGRVHLPPHAARRPAQRGAAATGAGGRDARLPALQLQSREDLHGEQRLVLPRLGRGCAGHHWRREGRHRAAGDGAADPRRGMADLQPLAARWPPGERGPGPPALPTARHRLHPATDRAELLRLLYAVRRAGPSAGEPAIQGGGPGGAGRSRVGDAGVGRTSARGEVWRRPENGHCTGRPEPRRSNWTNCHREPENSESPCTSAATALHPTALPPARPPFHQTPAPRARYRAAGP